MYQSKTYCKQSLRHTNRLNELAVWGNDDSDTEASNIEDEGIESDIISECEDSEYTLGCNNTETDEDSDAYEEISDDEISGLHEA